MKGLLFSEQRPLAPRTRSHPSVPGSPLSCLLKGTAIDILPTLSGSTVFSNPLDRFSQHTDTLLLLHSSEEPSLDQNALSATAWVFSSPCSEILQRSCVHLSSKVSLQLSPEPTTVSSCLHHLPRTAPLQPKVNCTVLKPMASGMVSFMCYLTRLALGAQILV